MTSPRERPNLACEACILAGGLGSRMGKDKAALRLGGKSLLAHIRAAAKQAELPVRVIRRDQVPRCGPLGGVYTALRTTRAESVLFLSCDMPFITGPLLRKMWRRLTPQTTAVFIDQGGFGFPFLVRKQALALVTHLLETEQFSLHGFARQLQAVPMPLPRGHAHAVLNINTVEDYQRACLLLKSQCPPP